MARTGLLAAAGIARTDADTTDHPRGGDTNVVETGRYRVDIVVETADGRIGPASTTWAPAGCYHQRLIVRVTADRSVEFLQREC